MTAAVETMAYNEAELPWHGEGTPVPDDITLDDMLIAAELDWEVEKRPIAIQQGVSEEGHPIWAEDQSRKAMVRNSDGKIFDVTSKNWNPVQNRDAFEFFRSFSEAGQVRMETAGSLRDGRIVFGLAKIIGDVKATDGDAMDGYLLFANSHAAGQAFVIKTTTVRVVCCNTLSIALGAEWGSTNAKSGEGVYKMRHTNVFDERAIAEAKEVIGVARDDVSNFAKLANQLKAINLSEDDVKRLLQPIYAPKVSAAELVGNFDKNATASLKTIMQSYHRAPGAEPGSAWGMLNAVTHAEDHVVGRSAKTRLNSSLLGLGSFRKQQVAKIAAELV